MGGVCYKNKKKKQKTKNKKKKNIFKILFYLRLGFY